MTDRRSRFMPPVPGKPRRTGGRSRAQLLRENPTPAERELWKILRDRRLERLKFRRQSPLGIFVADFYCHALKLVVELDGEVHTERRQAAHDENRDLYLRSLGCTILRFPNRDVFTNPDYILNRILETAQEIQKKVDNS
ncbi:MAG TPA: endonuclease domain-containing protein [Thermoanaerobaculia bacterium]|nr:endonuclease domain-containing protein [Thermoanaerobaculia bacterium]